MPPKSAPRKNSTFGLAYILGVVVVVALAVVGVALLMAPKSGSNAVGRTKGDPNARIEFIEYSDFQ